METFGGQLFQVGKGGPGKGHRAISQIRRDLAARKRTGRGVRVGFIPAERNLILLRVSQGVGGSGQGKDGGVCGRQSHLLDE